MKIRRLGPAKIILSNPQSKHNYFAWPSVVRLQNGRFAVAASGFRLAHCDRSGGPGCQRTCLCQRDVGK